MTFTSPIVVQDILDNANDYISNYTTGSIDTGNRMRAVNRAIEYIKRRMTLPSDELIYRFYYTDDTLYYNLTQDFNEGLFVLYDNQDHNFPGNDWTYAPYGDILRMSGRKYPNQKYFSWSPINGQMQLVMFGKNRHRGQTLSTFDSITNSGYKAQNDAQNIRNDINIKKEGSASLAFDINPALGGSGMASIYFPTNYDFTTIFDNNGLFKLWVWLASINLTEINLVLMTDVSDYYVLSATTFDDSTAFSTGLETFKRIQFGFTGATIVGSPNIQNITAIRIDFVLNGSFGSSIVSNFRVDDLYSIVPDYMDFIYLTSYKGTDKTGLTQKIFLTDPTDIPAFGLFIPDMIDVVSMRTAINLVPQIMSNAEFRQMYISEHEELMKIVGKSWPRKRVINMGRLVLSRPK